MSGRVVRATPAELRQVSAAVKAKGQELSAELEALNAEVERFADAFEGRAAALFGTRLAEWHRAAGGSATTIDALAGYLSSAADTLEGVDRSLGDGLGAGTGGSSASGSAGSGGGNGASGTVARPGPTPPAEPIAPILRPMPQPPTVEPPPLTVKPIDHDATVIRTHLQELEQRHAAVLERLLLVRHRLDWIRTDLVGLEATQADLVAQRAAAVAAGADPALLHHLDADLAAGQARLDLAQDDLARLQEREAGLVEQEAQIRDDHADLGAAVGEPPIPPPSPPLPPTPLFGRLWGARS